MVEDYGGRAGQVEQGWGKAAQCKTSRGQASFCPSCPPQAAIPLLIFMIINKANPRQRPVGIVMAGGFLNIFFDGV